MEGITIMPGSIRSASANCAAAIGLKGATGCGEERGEGEAKDGERGAKNESRQRWSVR